jgi:hypothetical protein
MPAICTYFELFLLYIYKLTNVPYNDLVSHVLTNKEESVMYCFLSCSE